MTPPNEYVGVGNDVMFPAWNTDALLMRRDSLRNKPSVAIHCAGDMSLFFFFLSRGERPFIGSYLVNFEEEISN
jgi:hypothetical protein